MKNNTIPPITEPIGRSWNQPDVREILVDDNYALMSKENIGKLLQYDSSMPTGVYEGKMWKRKAFCNGQYRMYLFWYGVSPDPNKCSINFRELIEL